ncbi:MAG: DUF1501 domain-containing protein [Pseudomonadota bacterium]
MAATPGDRRLVVIVLRGGMDGLDVVRPVGDPAFAAVRAGLLDGPSGEPLDNFFALHPALSKLMPLWRQGDLAFAHAVSTPYRDKRSHFEGQDMLEAGLPQVDGITKPDSGWMNRLLTMLPGATARTGFSVGREGTLILKGDAPHTTWYPSTALSVSGQAEALFELVYQEDPLFQAMSKQAFQLMEATDPDALEPGTPGHIRVADYLAEQLLQDTRVATFSITGWDSHRRQAAALRRPLGELADTIMHLQGRLGSVWDNTVVLAMTEFGRSVRENGTSGTDHGTGGAMLMAGGAVKGGRVYGRWPGLDEADLYARRDLMPTADVRGYAALGLGAMFGISQSDLESRLFPGLDMAGTQPFLA